jgi:hypothetical protein
MCAALGLTLIGCGAEAGSGDGVRDASLDGSTPVSEVVSQVRVVPIARKAIEQRLPNKTIADVMCTSEVVYVSEGSVTRCTATVDGVLSGWTLTFRDAAGGYDLARRPGAPWQFTTPSVR